MFSKLFSSGPPAVVDNPEDDDDDGGEREGGSAFPSDTWSGMSLREWFAGQALVGLVMSGADPQWAAVQAFQYADHMIKVGECPEEDDDDEDESDS